MNAPQARLNATRIRADRLLRARVIGAWICTLTVAAGTLLIAHMALALAVQMPDLVAAGAAAARW